ncbi:hypothetical protein chiPu_0003712 [Chiloscyllium punctatum]|uniref:Uncharacterized protein n=1 Tax=Chiloscyllium punctatum TaxID=137246 RepID=A0A401S4H1_CHIPU|nr:hypothetical protein [Chiloscyllium punctatum]
MGWDEMVGWIQEESCFTQAHPRPQLPSGTLCLERHTCVEGSLSLSSKRVAVPGIKVHANLNPVAPGAGRVVRMTVQDSSWKFRASQKKGGNYQATRTPVKLLQSIYLQPRNMAGISTTAKVFFPSLSTAPPPNQ